MRRLLPLLGLLLGACVAQVPLDERACPCANGWTCCVVTQTCMPRPEMCPGPGEPPPPPPPTDGGTDGGPGEETGEPDGGPGEPDGGDVDLAGRCYDRHWCWENPSPHARYSRAVWASGTGEVWAVGAPGIATRWDGSGWKD